MTVTEFLQTQVAFLAGLTQEQARTLATQAAQQSYHAGQTVILRGTTVEGLHVVAAGKVAVWAKPERGRTLVQVAELGPGEVFGETSILEMGTAGATIKALQDETLIFVIPQDAFRETLAQNAEISARASALIEGRKKKTAESVAVPAAVAA